jgi:hypothetical protein
MPTTYDDAKLLTAYDPADRRYAGAATISVGKDREAKIWRPQTMPVGQLVALLCKHREGPKNGLSFVLGDMVKGRRLKTAIKSLYAIGLDVDVGTPTAKIEAAQRQLGCLSVRYSTHSHLASKSSFKRDMLTKWAEKNVGEDVEIDSALIQDYLTEKGWEPSLVKTVEYTGDEHEEGGIMAVVRHAPMPKHRLIVPLKEPFIIADQGGTQAEAMKLWGKVATALAQLLDIPLDESCLDPSRLFYLPRHAPGRPYDISLHGGDLYDWRSLELENPWEKVAEQLGKSSGGSKSITAKGKELGRWSVKAAHGFLICQVVEDFAPDKVRNQTGIGIEVECPFDEGHSNAGDQDDRACWVVSAGDGPSQFFTIKCQHESCKSFTNLDMLGKMLEDDWFSDSVLEDDSYNAVVGERTLARAVSFSLPPDRFGKFAWQTLDGRTWLCRTGKDEDGALTTAFELKGGVRYPDRDDARALRVALQDEYGAEVEIDLAAADLAKSNGGVILGQLRSAGLCFTRAGAAFLIAYLCETQPRGVLLYDRPGWRDGAFLLPTGRALLTDREIALSGRARLDCEPTAGTFKDWKRGVAFICGTEATHLQAGVLLGFIGPIVDLIRADSAVFSFEGRTSTGKSTAQSLSAASWAPSGLGEGLFVSLKGTVNSLELPLERGSGTVAALDEARHVTAATAQDLVFTAQGGRGKRRMTASAEEQRTRGWRTAVSVSAETGFAQRLAMEGVAAAGGLAVRVTSIDTNDAPAFTPDEWAEITMATANFGHAGPKFIQALADEGFVQHPSELAEYVDDYAAWIAKSKDPIRHRAARNLALLGVAGKIAQTAGLLPATFNVGKLVKALWASFLVSDIAPADPVDKAIGLLCETIVARKGADIFEIGERTFREAVGYMDDYRGEAVFVIRASKLSELSGGAADDRALRKALVVRGYAIRDPRADRSAIAWSYWHGLARAAYIVLRRSKIEHSSCADDAAANDEGRRRVA